MDWTRIAELAGTLMSKGAKSQADQRHNTDALNVNRDVIDQRAVQAANATALARAQYADQRQQEAYKDAQRAQMLQHWAPTVRPQGVANISFVPGGGPSQAMLDRSRDMERMSTIRMLGGDQLPQVERYTATPAQQPSTLEKVLSILGPGATAASVLPKLFNDDNQTDGK